MESIGNLIDRYSILEITLTNQREIDSIAFCKKYIDMYPRLYKQLVFCNREITQKIGEIQNCMQRKRLRLIKTFTHLDIVNVQTAVPSSLITADKVGVINVRWYNELIQDQSKVFCVAFAENIIGKLDILGFLCVEYDVVYARIQSEAEEIAIRQILPNPNLCFFMGVSPPYTTFDLDNTTFDIPDVFKFEPIYYTSSGLLGDFVIQLSVVCENFYKTGRKGIVNMIDTVPFRKSLEETYADVKSIVKSQPYIEDLRIGFPENFEIYLSSWRYSEQLYKINMYDLLLQEYDIQFGKHKWIHTANDLQWNGKVVIHIVNYRFPINVNYQDIINQHGIENIVFLNMEDKDYEYFVETTGMTIPDSYKPHSFEELCIIINSCKLFVGATSMPLCIAHSTHVPRIVGLPDNNDVKMMASGLIHHIPNIISEL